MDENELYEQDKKFLSEYCKTNNVEDICMLFDKDTLVDNVHDSDWDWAVRDEIETKGVSKEQAEHNALEWFKLMDNHTLFYNRMSEWTRQALINVKADELRGK